MTRAGGVRAAINRERGVTGEGHPRGIWGMALKHMSGGNGGTIMCRHDLLGRV